ncbi:hypothetical protein MRB53_036838 [Persea americana]|nr:hypothetical protein MRB53_036838 [Persea americana]
MLVNKPASLTDREGKGAAPSGMSNGTSAGKVMPGDDSEVGAKEDFVPKVKPVPGPKTTATTVTAKASPHQPVAFPLPGDTTTDSPCVAGGSIVGTVEEGRPISPTKGLGGFVQSAMMRRSDSLSKRWSTHSPASISRQNSSSNLMGSGELASSSASPLSSTALKSDVKQDERLHSNVESQPRASGTPRPGLTLHTDRSFSGAVSAQASSIMGSNVEAATTSPSKRWSPAKSTWLESALGKPEPKPSVVSPQPDWMTGLSKTRSSKESSASPDARQAHTDVQGPSVELSAVSVSKKTPPKPRKTSSQVAADAIRGSSSGATKTATSRGHRRAETLDSGAKVALGPDLRSQLRPRPSSPGKNSEQHPEFLNALGALKRTATGSKVSSSSVDLVQPQSRSTAKSDVVTPPSVVPKKKALGRSTSGGNVQPTFASAPSDHITQQSKVGTRHESEEAPNPHKHKLATGPATATSPVQDSKLATKFNPNLASVLARGPLAPPQAIGGAQAANLPFSGTVSDAGHEVLETQPQLQHMTKARARGPKRRLPTAQEDSRDPLPLRTSSKLDAPVGKPRPLIRSSSRNVTPSSPDQGNVRQSLPSADEVAVGPRPVSAVPKQFEHQKRAVATGKDGSSTNQAAKNSIEAESPSAVRSATVDSTNTATPTSEIRSASQNAKQSWHKSSTTSQANGKTAWNGAPGTEPGMVDGLRSSLSQAAVQSSEIKLATTTPVAVRLPKPAPTVAPKPGVTKDLASRASMPRPQGGSHARRCITSFFNDPEAEDGQLDSAVVQSLYASEQSPAPRIKTLRKTILEVLPDGRTAPLPLHQDHILFASSAYVCTHVYGDAKGTRTTAVYLWIGANVPHRLSDTNTAVAKGIARDCSANVVQVQQGKEDSNFLQALGGILITRQGSSAAAPQPFLLCGKRISVHRFAPDEQALPLERTRIERRGAWLCQTHAMDLRPGGNVVEIEAGKETPEFFASFPASNSDLAHPEYWSLKANSEAYRTRLFSFPPDPLDSTSISNSITAGAASLLRSWTRGPSAPTSDNQHSSPAHASTRSRVVEVHPFSPRDIEVSGIYVLDTWFEVYVIAAPLSTKEYRAFRTAVSFARKYAQLASKPLAFASRDEARPAAPAGWVTLGSAVPDEVKHAFRGWQHEGIGGTEALMAARSQGDKLVKLSLEEACAARRRYVSRRDNGDKKYAFRSRISSETHDAAETAIAECVSDEALIHLKSYKYSSVDKSYISRYILKHYVRPPAKQGRLRLTASTVEWLRRTSPTMAGSKHGHIARLLLHTGKRRPAVHFRPGPSWAR